MNLIKRPKNFSYEQINVSIGTANKETFPEECPTCSAGRTKVTSGICAEAHYSCGGSYSSISQIQNHTDKYRGACGEEEKYNTQEKVVTLVIFYNMFCNWSLFPEELKSKMGTEVPTVKRHILYKLRQRLSRPTDWVKDYVKWVDDNYEEFKGVLDTCLGNNNHEKFIDPRFICGFTDEWEPIYETDPTECLVRLRNISHDEYGRLRFQASFFWTSLLPTGDNMKYIIKDVKISGEV